MHRYAAHLPLATFFHTFGVVLEVALRSWLRYCTGTFHIFGVGRRATLHWLPFTSSVGSCGAALAPFTFSVLGACVAALATFFHTFGVGGASIRVLGAFIRGAVAVGDAARRWTYSLTPAWLRAWTTSS